jgi:2-(1,2-epoxy-1,2-dihydrophenyl)acetyl-CoA isomerase
VNTDTRPDPDAPAPGGLVRYTAENGIARLEMNRPERLNAASPELTSDLRDALARAETEDVRVVILSGAGRAFSAGHDLKAAPLAHGSPEEETHLDNLQDITRLLRRADVVSIAAVHGYALGAGFEFALSCDFVVADREAVFRFPEVSVGLSVTGGISFLLPQAVGLPAAKELIMLGEAFDATRAHELGLVARVADTGEHQVAATQLAERILALPRGALTVAKDGLESSMRAGMEAAMQLEIEHASLTGEGAEADRARAAFARRGTR